jgi:hypothetical protein
MARRNKLIMASVFEDTKTLQIYLLWTCQGRIETMRTRQQRHGKFMTVDYLQLDLAMSYLCSTFVLF